MGVRESPKKVEGAYIQPLPTLPPGERFHGRLGLYLQGGHLAFFRRPGSASNDVDDGASVESLASPWECTGFVSDLAWAAGQRLTPCLAFRSEGAYKVRLARISKTPPGVPLRPGISQAIGWNGLDWEADPLTTGDG